MKLNPLLLIDYYKATHADQYPKNITRLVSYYTPRMSRLGDDKPLIHFGLQYFIKEYLIDSFNENFFNRPKEEVIEEYKYYINNTLPDENDLVSKIEDLYDLGYLPLEIYSLLEGKVIPMQVPCLAITNSHPEFAWLVNTIESLLSATLWHAQLSASVGHWYKKIVNKYYDLTCDDNISKESALGDFSFRGQESLESGVVSSAGFLLSFVNSATVPAGYFLEKYYNANLEIDNSVIRGSVSSEHSVMCSNYAVDGDEVTMVKRLLTEIYPNTSFSMVSDSYDYWNLVDNILPQCRTEIENHNGCLLVRGDSGNPVEIVTQTVFHLWDIFGGTVNRKGYKVLNPKVKAIYGDSITVQRAEEVYKILMENGYAASNVALGVGSFSMQCVEEDNILKPFTRDTYSSAVKSTYCEISGKPINIFKNPKTDTGHFKKSQKGCCLVTEKDGKLVCQDELTWEEANSIQNKLLLVFRDGEMLIDQSLHGIRRRINLHD